MFDQLNNRLGSTLKKLRGQARLTEDNMQQTLREVRRSLLEADVGLSVIKQFLADIQQRYVGEDVANSLTPGQQIVKIIHSELQRLLGENQHPLNLAQQPPAIILLAGLQGVGKTTSAGKLAHNFKQQKNKVLLASVDVYRPAAIEQLKILASQAQVDFFQTDVKQPLEIAKLAQQYASQYLFDVLIIDTAGRLNVDSEMMQEIKALQQQVNPSETLLVADSQQGQDAVNVAKIFAETIDLTGLVFTKVDGDARGGAIMSVRHMTGKPIKLIAVGEKMEDLQEFHPNRIASRILGMGDMLSLVEDIESKTDRHLADKMTKKLQKGSGLDFNDMLEQFSQMDKMGGMQSIMDKVPSMGRFSGAMQSGMDDTRLKQQRALILSMTKQERANPEIIKGSRRRRIATGAGVHVQEVNRLLKQQKQMKGMLKKMKNKNFMKQMQGLMRNRS